MAKPKSDPAAKELLKVKKEAISRILKKSTKSINWPCEIKIINKLYENYPNLEFWRTFDTQSFNFALPSLAWFLTDKGKVYLAQEYRRATSDLSSLINKAEEQQIFDLKPEKVEVVKKILTLKDFLK